MAKRIKKAAVRPELCKQWLRRFEEDGESPPRIAESDGYDVRTVRKQIQQAMQEREMREARGMVLRDALEKHYKDLCTFAEKLDSGVSWPPTPVSPIFSQDRMWQALKEHLPRSPIWKAILRWESLVDQFSLCVKQVEECAKVKAEAQGLNFAQAPGEAGLGEGFVRSIASHLVGLARGQKGLKDIAEFSHKKAADTDLHEAMMGAFYLAVMNPDKMESLKTIYSKILDEAIGWEEADELRKVVSELERQSRVLHDELATIILRRVVPGRCRYCPI